MWVGRDTEAQVVPAHQVRKHYQNRGAQRRPKNRGRRDHPEKAPQAVRHLRENDGGQAEDGTENANFEQQQKVERGQLADKAHLAK